MGTLGDATGESAIQALAATFAALTGEPAAAVAAAGAAPLLTHASQRALEGLRRRRAERVNRLLDQTSQQAHTDAAQVVATLLEQPGGPRLLDRALTAAQQTSRDEVIATAAAALARAVHGEGDADADQLLVTVLADLEEPHLRLLVHLRETTTFTPQAGSPPWRGSGDFRGWMMPATQADKVAAALDWPTHLVAPVMATLDRHGLVTMAPGGRYDSAGELQAAINDFGRWVLDQLDDSR